MYDVLLADYPRLPAETDDSARIQRAIDACENGILCIPKGDYQIASPLVIRNRCHLWIGTIPRRISPSRIGLRCMSSAKASSKAAPRQCEA